MIKYQHVNDHLGGFPQIRYFDEPSSIIVKNGQGQRSGGSYYFDKVRLARRGELFNKLFKTREEAWPQAKEKELLIYNRITAIIQLTKIEEVEQ